ncbi:hypothetical protein GCM10010182_82020 [Actinomadura cremea]|nr:hypothetical protein GCM10010182_82020 [Actinomadura cremea]
MPLAEMIKHWENGRHAPSSHYRELYVKVAGMTEQDFFGSNDRQPANEPDTPQLDPDERERLALAIDRPVSVDHQVVETLATILAAERRLDDSVGPAAILHATTAHMDVTARLLRDARGPVRDALAPVAGEYVQFGGWLHAQLRNDRQAAHLLTDAEALADDARDGVLAAQATNFKGWLARQQRSPRGVVRHFLAAFHTPGSSPAQRLGDAVQAAHGYALAGDAPAARELLREAEALEEPAARSLPPGTAYWLTPDFQHRNIGLALLALQEHAAAVDHIGQGLASLPADQQGAAWTREYRAALEHAQESR